MFTLVRVRNGFFFKISHYIFRSYKAMYEAGISLSVYPDHHIFWQTILFFASVYIRKNRYLFSSKSIIRCKTLRILWKLLPWYLKNNKKIKFNSYLPSHKIGFLIIKMFSCCYFNNQIVFKLWTNFHEESKF